MKTARSVMRSRLCRESLWTEGGAARCWPGNASWGQTGWGREGERRAGG